MEDVPRSRLVNYIKKRIYSNVNAVLIPAISHIESYERWGVPEGRMFFGVDVIDNDWFREQSEEFENVVVQAGQICQLGFFLG